MQISSLAIGTAAAVGITIIGIGATPFVFANRVPLGTTVGSFNISGVSHEDLAGVLKRYEQEILGEKVTLELQGVTAEYTLQDLGVSVDIERTVEKFEKNNLPWEWAKMEQKSPILSIDEKTLQKAIIQKMATVISVPKDATVTFSPAGTLVVVPSAQGDKIDTTPLKHEIEKRLVSKQLDPADKPIELSVISAQAEIQDNEVNEALTTGKALLTNGMELTFEDKSYTIQPFTIQRLIQFIPREVGIGKNTNTILGVTLDQPGLISYLEQTLVPEIDQEPINAKFEVSPEGIENGGRVTQFAQPQRGQKLNVESSAARIVEAVTNGQRSVALDVAVVDPLVSDTVDMERIGIKKLLATGVSDFAGSPKNRVYNIEVGASKYHGLLLAPGEEFSFNKFLGPVNAEGGFKPELVIKQNVTVPEYGGGLCQVSSTIFRAAAQAGMKITERRNHSYAVRYYGEPGFDATIYPGYTDFRFLNNTPGYVLIQTRIVGTKLYFELWGTDDGRQVEIVGPRTFDRKPDGAVKATLTQIVKKDGQVLIEDEFFSNYKSPKLFPKATAENGE